MYDTEDEVYELIKPVVERQEAINIFIIKLIAERIKEIGELLPSDLHSLGQLAKTGADVRAINAEIARVAKLQIRDIKNIIKEAAQNIYTDTKPFFDYRKKPFIPYSENEPVQKVVKAMENQTSGTYRNMAKAQAFMIRDPHNPKVLLPTTPARAYQNTVDEAIQTVQSDTKDYTTAMREKLKELTDSGLKEVQYETESGKIHTQRMDTALKRNLMDGVRAVNQEMQNELGKQFGADGVEITVHNYPAPDHCYVQGHQFSMAEYAKISPMPTIQTDGSIDNSVYEPYKVPKDEDFDEYDNDNWVFDINGKRYSRFSRRIGTCNCRHFAYNIVIGYAPPNYTEEQLKEILDANEKGVIVDGVHYTMYEATQVQRRLELNIRRSMEEQIAMKAAGDMEGVRKAQEDVERYLHEYQDFSNKAGLRMKYDRIRVDGYKEVKF